jgi:hypothetical protein
MSLLDAFLKKYAADSSSEGNVDDVGKPLSTTSTNVQGTENKANINTPHSPSAPFQTPMAVFSESEKPFKHKEKRSYLPNVDDVACVRENESSKLTSLSQEKSPPKLSSVGPLARASNNVNKWECVSCPACGRWNGCGPWWWKMLQGHYCFYTAFFSDVKTGRPVPLEKAAAECPLTKTVGHGRQHKTERS